MNTSALTGLKDSAATFWNEREPRERNMLLAAAAVILLALIYLFFISPALSGKEQLEKSLPQLRQQAAELQMLARQVGEAGGSATPPAPVTKESIEASLARRNLKPQSTLVSGELVKVQLQSASFAAIMDWLQEMQTTSRLSVTESSIEALAAVDTVNATLALRQQGAGTKNE